MSQPSGHFGVLASLPFKQRNYALDALFYDVGSLAPSEIAALSPAIDREGSVIVVPPVAARQPIRHYRTALRFMNNDGANIRAMVVAGVGSSVVGTAALARNVADAFNCDVAGVVTGYGMTDLLTEALGGWFIFGAADRARLELESKLQALTAPLPDRIAGSLGDLGVSLADVFTDRLVDTADVATLLDVLIANPPKLELLVGHSKGSLLIDFVLERFVEEIGPEHPLYRRLQIVTLGAVVRLPAQFPRTRQLLGERDWFGWLNSHPRVAYDTVPNAGHHLNRAIPFYLDVAQALRGAMPRTSGEVVQRALAGVRGEAEEPRRRAGRTS